MACRLGVKKNASGHFHVNLFAGNQSGNRDQQDLRDQGRGAERNRIHDDERGVRPSTTRGNRRKS